MSPDDIDLEKALGLLSLPREVGLSPEDGEPIVAGIGRFGPYVKHGKTYANLEDGDDVLTIGLNRAVTLIAEKRPIQRRAPFRRRPRQGFGRAPRRRGASCGQEWPLRALRDHNGINATIPADKTPEAITLTEAVVLLDARADQLSAQPRRAAGRKKAGEPSEAPKGRKKKAEAADKGDKSASPRKKPAKKAAKVTAAE